MYCSKCGKGIADGSRFCPKCGAQLDAPTPPPAPVATAATRTYGQTGAADMVYPKNPPVSPHMAWLCIVWPGIPHLIHGQTAKGAVLMVASFLSLIFPVFTIGIIVASTIDALNVGKVLASGRAVGKWAWFPS